MNQQKSPDPNRLLVDGKIIHKYLFGRKSTLDGRSVFAAVEAFDKDHAIKRLSEYYPSVNPFTWDFLDEIDPEHFMGSMGTDIPLIGLIISKRI